MERRAGLALRDQRMAKKKGGVDVSDSDDARKAASDNVLKGMLSHQMNCLEMKADGHS